ncbi:MAG TPA: 2-dehydropantoate 2-reductase [Candidatus Sulfotelmatobacter sp.]|nr:2-dehydropantoate 2-reductase [Candidatus Sulfotelmatobacter sp.]
MAKRVCIVGCGAIGSLYAAHLARVAEVHAFVRRADHARDLNEHGLRVSGVHEFSVRLRASANPGEIPECDLGIVCSKATQTAEAVGPVADRFVHGAVLSAQNGLGCEEVIADLTKGYVMRGTTFMSGSRRGDTEVKMELDTETWLGPFEPTGTPFSLVRDAAELIVASGLKAEALEDARPAQWSKLIFNASVNSVSALTELPHCAEFAAEREFADLGHLLHALIEEGRQVAHGLGVELHDDPWEMNKIGAQTDHPPSMLYDVQHHLATEVDFLGGAIAREAERHGLSAPLHTALYRLIKGKEASWNWKPEDSRSSKGSAKHG